MIPYDLVKRNIEALYDGLCTVYEKTSTKDKDTKITTFTDSAVVINQPCRLSFQSISPVQDANPGTVVTQVIKLFLAPDITIKPGSKIVVTQSGVTSTYTCSGAPAIYLSHQELVLKAFERWA